MHEAPELSGIARHDAIPFMQALMQRIDVDLVEQIDGGDGVENGIGEPLRGDFILVRFQFCDPILKAGDALGQRFESGRLVLLAGCVSFAGKGRGDPGSDIEESEGKCCRLRLL